VAGLADVARPVGVMVGEKLARTKKVGPNPENHPELVDDYDFRDGEEGKPDAYSSPFGRAFQSDSATDSSGIRPGGRSEATRGVLRLLRVGRIGQSFTLPIRSSRVVAASVTA
jgi:hypothetical protein